MRAIAKLLVLSIAFTVCLSLVGCSGIHLVWYGINSEFGVAISRSSGWDALNFEVTESYLIRIWSLDGSSVECDDVQIEYNEGNLIVTSSYSSKNQAAFRAYCHELGSGEISITYRGKTESVSYSIADYNFEENRYETISSIEDLDKYPAFKEMLLSLEYHEFKEPYIGLSKWEYDYDTNENIVFKYDCKNFTDGYMSTEYLQYLLDSVYYPSKFIGYDMGMTLYKDTDVSEGATKTTMKNFGLSLSVSDPHHNKRSDSITGLYFSVYDINTFDYMYKGQCIYPDIVRLEKYPEKFFKYRFGDLTIYILCTKDSGAKAYFMHGDYLYELIGSYDFE